MSSVSKGLYFLTLPLVGVMRVMYRKICHARYLYIERNVKKVWGARHTLGARYLSKNTVVQFLLTRPCMHSHTDVCMRMHAHTQLNNHHKNHPKKTWLTSGSYFSMEKIEGT